MRETEPSAERRPGGDRRRSRRIRTRNAGAFAPAQTGQPLKRSRRWRRKVLIFRLLVVALLATIAAALYLILRSPGPAVSPREPSRGLDFQGN